MELSLLCLFFTPFCEDAL